MIEHAIPDTPPPYGILGPLRVIHGGEPATPSSAMQRRLLTALLLAPGAVVSADRLEWVLWGDHPPRTARKTLHTLVSRLRARLGEEAIATRPPGYALEVPPDDLDAVRCERLVGAAQDMLVADPAGALARLELAESLWRGPALAEFRDEEFASADAHRLEELRLVGQEARMEALAALGRHQEAIPQLEAFVAEHELRERPHHLLMTALYRAGRAPDALRVYQTFRTRLVDELGLDPSPELQELETRILQQDPELDAPAPPPRADRARLPAANTRIVGRNRDLAALADAFSRTRLVTVVGPPGVGKTRLAMAHGRQVEDTLADGVRWCELADVAEDDAVPDAVVSALGLYRRADTPPTELLIAALRGQGALVVLDNCEHVVAGASALATAITRHCPTVSVLATSRERLGLLDEHVFPLQPLPTTALDGAVPPAVELFRERASAVAPGVDLDDPLHQDAADRICRRLDGLPLAIELAAARMRHFSPEEILDGLQDRFAALGVPPRGAVARHRTLRAALEWSCGQLTEEEAVVFGALSVFAGGFDLAAASGVADPLLSGEEPAAVLVAKLVDKSLLGVARRGRATRYMMLETLAAFARERLRSYGIEGAALDAHRDWVVRSAEEHAPRLRGGDEPDAVRRLDAEIANLRAAHGRAVRSGDVDTALRLSEALHHFAYQRLRDEVFDWGEAALSLAGADNHPSFPFVLGSVAQGLASRGDLKRAVELATQGLAAAGDADALAVQPLHALGVLALYRGDLTAAEQLAEREVAAAEGAGDHFQAAFGQVTAVLARAYAGRPDHAALTELQRLADASGSPSQLAWAHYATGETQRLVDSAAALGHFDQAVELGRQVRNDFVVGVSLLSISVIRAEHGEPDIALATFGRIVEHWAERGCWTHQATTLRNLVVLLTRLGAHQEAAELVGACDGAPEGTASFGAADRRLAAARDELRRALGASRFEAAMAHGRTLDTGGAIALARAATAAAD